MAAAFGFGDTNQTGFVGRSPESSQYPMAARRIVIFLAASDHMASGTGLVHSS